MLHVGAGLQWAGRRLCMTPRMYGGHYVHEAVAACLVGWVYVLLTVWAPGYFGMIDDLSVAALCVAARMAQARQQAPRVIFIYLFGAGLVRCDGTRSAAAGARGMKTLAWYPRKWAKSEVSLRTVLRAT